MLTDKGVTGWVSYEQMELTLNPDGSEVDFAPTSLEDLTNAKWEAGLMAGDFGGANMISAYGSYSLNPNLSVEVWGSHFLGDFSNGWMGSVNVVHEAFPEWRFSPFFTLGAGLLHTSPKSTIISGEDRTDEVGHVGVGLRIYATRRFFASCRIQKLRGVYEPRRQRGSRRMESRIRVLFLIIALIGLSGCAATKNLFGIEPKDAPPPSTEPPGQVIDPQVERREIKEPKIDREDFEAGGFVGIMSIEDFGTNVVYGVRLAYHVTEGVLCRRHSWPDRRWTYQL